MKNYIQPGKRMTYTAGANISAGDVVILDHRIAIALTDIANGSKGTLELEGVFELSSDTGTAYVQGDKLFYDSGNKRLTKTAAGNTPAGEAFEAKQSAATVARVRITDHPKQAANVADASSETVAETINAVRDACVNAGLMKNA